jgi:hypothetical protein
MSCLYREIQASQKCHMPSSISKTPPWEAGLSLLSSEAIMGLFSTAAVAGPETSVLCLTIVTKDKRLPEPHKGFSVLVVQKHMRHSTLFIFHSMTIPTGAPPPSPQHDGKQWWRVGGQRKQGGH